jgi:hypothetical protein
MQFTVPQFIEREAKIVGPLTFKQLIFIAAPGAICFFLYFTLAKTNFILFLILAIILLGGGLAFAFVNVGGQPLPFFLINFLKFNISPKIYLWAKKETISPTFKKEEVKKVEEEKKEEKLPLKVTLESKLKKIRNYIETKSIP